MRNQEEIRALQEEEQSQSQQQKDKLAAERALRQKTLEEKNEQEFAKTKKLEDELQALQNKRQERVNELKQQQEQSEQRTRVFAKKIAEEEQLELEALKRETEIAALKRKQEIELQQQELQKIYEETINAEIENRDKFIAATKQRLEETKQKRLQDIGMQKELELHAVQEEEKVVMQEQKEQLVAQRIQDKKNWEQLIARDQQEIDGLEGQLVILKAHQNELHEKLKEAQKKSMQRTKELEEIDAQLTVLKNEREDEESKQGRVKKREKGGDSVGDLGSNKNDDAVSGNISEYYIPKIKKLSPTIITGGTITDRTASTPSHQQLVGAQGHPASEQYRTQKQQSYGQDRSSLSQYEDFGAPRKNLTITKGLDRRSGFGPLGRRNIYGFNPLADASSTKNRDLVGYNYDSRVGNVSDEERKALISEGVFMKSDLADNNRDMQESATTSQGKESPVKIVPKKPQLVTTEKEVQQKQNQEEENGYRKKVKKLPQKNVEQEQIKKEEKIVSWWGILTLWLQKQFDRVLEYIMNFW
jgi:hypothetical protein